MYVVKFFLYFRVTFDYVLISDSRVILSHLRMAHHSLALCSIRMALYSASRAIL
jgi:hypothetical protein